MLPCSTSLEASRALSGWKEFCFSCIMSLWGAALKTSDWATSTLANLTTHLDSTGINTTSNSNLASLFWSTDWPSSTLTSVLFWSWLSSTSFKTSWKVCFAIGDPENWHEHRILHIKLEIFNSIQHLHLRSRFWNLPPVMFSLNFFYKSRHPVINKTLFLPWKEFCWELVEFKSTSEPKNNSKWYFVFSWLIFYDIFATSFFFLDFG